MAEITDVRTPYELLVRGRPGGGIAAHVQHRRIVMLGDEVMKDEVEPAIAISPEAVEGTPFQELIGVATIVAIQDNEARAAVMAEQAAQIEALTTERDRLASTLLDTEARAAEAAQAQAQKIAELTDALNAMTRPKAKDAAAAAKGPRRKRAT